MKTGKKWIPNGELDTPYKRASKEWDDRIGSAVVQAKNWRLATFATLLFVALPSVWRDDLSGCTAKNGAAYC